MENDDHGDQSISKMGYDGQMSGDGGPYGAPTVR